MKIKIHQFLNSIALFIWIATIVYIIVNWTNLPNEVPTHYNFRGEPDSWGNKWFVFFPPTIGIALWLFMGAIGNPKTWQFLSVKEQSAAQIENSVAMLRTIQAEILLIFSFISIKDVYTVKGGNFHLGIWEMIIVLTVLFSTCALFAWRGHRINKKEAQSNVN